MIFSVVEIQTYKRCKRKWGLQSDNLGNLQPLKVAPALQLGSLIHETLALWTESPQEDPSDLYLRRVDKALQSIKQAYLTTVGAPVSPEELDPFYEAVALGAAMVANYAAFYRTPLPDTYRSIQTEQRVVIAVPYTEHFLRGTIDNLVEDVRTGQLFVLERKTYAQRPTVEKLQMDDQMMAYLWMLYQLFGIDKVGGILYDGLWKRDGSSARHTSDDLFFRHVFQRAPHEFVEYEDGLFKVVQDMAADAQDPAGWYPNRRWEGCTDCGMEKLCRAMTRGEDVDYVRNTFYTQRPVQASSEDVGGSSDTESE